MSGNDAVTSLKNRLASSLLLPFDEMADGPEMLDWGFAFVAIASGTAFLSFRETAGLSREIGWTLAGLAATVLLLTIWAGGI